jgi:peroxiredoxin
VYSAHQITESVRRKLILLAILTLAVSFQIGCGQTEARPQAQEPSPTAVADIPATAMPPTATPTLVPAPTTNAITTPKVAKLNEPAPDFELELFTGEKMRLSDLKGKVVVLNFWASWCPPCRREMPGFEKTWQEYEERGVVFVGVAVQDHEPDSRAFAKEVGVTYPIGIDWDGRIFDKYRPTAMPTTFMINREGLVSRRIANYANEAMLRIFLKGQLDQ